MRSVFLFLTLLLCLNVASANPFFDGTVRYQYLGGNQKVTLSHERISNSSNQNTTGTIRISLWATTYAYGGGQLQGTRVASYKLEGLKPGYYWKAASETLSAAPPPSDGYYYMTMTAEEYTHDGYVITDWITFDTQAYSKRPAPAPKKSVSNKLLSMSGPYRWQTYPSENLLEIGTGTIKHTRNGTTGGIRVTVWATKNRYTGGRITGWILGYVQKEQLQKGYVYKKIETTVPYSPPPLGQFYYITIALSEYDGREYVIRDHYTFDNGSWF